MKQSKGRRFLGKKSIISSVLVVVLAGAIFINWRYGDVSNVASQKQPKTGKAEYVSTSKVKVETGYFADAKKERETAYADAVAEFEALEKDSKASESDKSAAYQAHIALIERQEKQVNIETLVKAKDFADCLVVIGDEEVSVVVKADDLAASEILQIQDLVLSVLDVPLDNVKIIHVK